MQPNALFVQNLRESGKKFEITKFQLILCSIQSEINSEIKNCEISILFSFQTNYKSLKIWPYRFSMNDQKCNRKEHVQSPENGLKSVRLRLFERQNGYEPNYGQRRQGTDHRMQKSIHVAHVHTM